MSGRSRSSILGGALVFSSKERGMLVCVCVCVCVCVWVEASIIFSRMSALPGVWPICFYFLSENIQNFLRWSPASTWGNFTPGVKIRIPPILKVCNCKNNMRCVCVCVCVRYILPKQRQCCREILRGFERRAAWAPPKGGDDHGTDARLSLSTQRPNYRFKRGLR